MTLRMIRQISDAGVHIMCSSRVNTLELRNQLQQPEESEIYAHSHDIDCYLSRRLSQEWQYDEADGRKILEKLKVNAVGKYVFPLYLRHCRFLLAKFQLDYVLDFLEPQDSLDALQMLPADMKAAYEEIKKKD